MKKTGQILNPSMILKNGFLANRVCLSLVTKSFNAQLAFRAATLLCAFLFAASNLLAQQATQTAKVYDEEGNTYNLQDLQVDELLPTLLDFEDTEYECSGSYFVPHFASGSGFEDPDDELHAARRSVLCQLFIDLSSFIIPEDPNQQVHVLVKPAFAGANAVALATNLFALPPSSTNSAGIADNAVWLTINSGEDAYQNLMSPTLAAYDNDSFYHGFISFNFSDEDDNPLNNGNSATDLLFNYDLLSYDIAGTIDFYAVALHEMGHLLGVMSAIAPNGSSDYLLGGNPYSVYYSRYDTFLESWDEHNLIVPTSPEIMYGHEWNPIFEQQNLTPANVLNSSMCEDRNYFRNGSLEIELAGNSRSHFSEECSVSNNNDPDFIYYVMHYGTNSSNEMVRKFAEEERLALCTLGYSLNDHFGSPNNINYNEAFYTGGICNENMRVAGVSDGIEDDGTCSLPFFVETGDVIELSGADILTNDIATGFRSLEVMHGDGSIDITEGDYNTTFHYDLTSSTVDGFHILRYVPTKGDRYGNITYIYFYKTSDACDDLQCNLVQNNDFEAHAGCIQPQLPYCWEPYCWDMNCWAEKWVEGCGTIFNSSWEIDYSFEEISLPPGVNGETMMGLGSSHIINPNGAEFILDVGMQTHLSQPLENGEYYTLRYWARVGEGTDFEVSPGTVQTGVAASILMTGTNNYSNLNTGITPFGPNYNIPADGQWHQYEETFLYEGPTGQVFVIGQDSEGSLMPSQFYVWIDEIEIIPGSDILFLNPGLVCTGSSINDLSQWASPAGGIFSGEGVIFENGVYKFEPSAMGNYDVTYTVETGGICGSISQTVTIPVGQLGISVSDDIICPGQGSLFEFNSGANLSWSTTDFLEFSGSTALSTPTEDITYTVTGLGIGGCTINQTIAIAVESWPQEMVVTTNGPVCNGDEITLDVVTPEAGVTYIFYMDDAAAENDPASAYTTVLTETTSFDLLATNEAGCTVIEEDNAAVVLLLPEITISPEEGEICAGESIELSASGAATYEWSPVETLSGGEGASVLASPIETSTYTVSGTDENGCSGIATVEVFTELCCDIIPTISFASTCNFLPGSSFQLISDYVEEDATYLWHVNGAGFTSFEISPFFTVDEPGDYTVYLVITSPLCGELDPITEILTIYPFDDAGHDVDLGSQTEVNDFVTLLQDNGNSMSFGQDIIFGNGTNQVIVTISDAIFNLGPDVDIIINEYASVTFNRCTFTSCSTWQGFDVRSNSQTSAPSGSLAFDISNIQNANNYSTIEYAQIGIAVRDERTQAGSTPMANLQGGKLRCGRTRFTNCVQAFDTRNATNKTSYFKLCTFMVNITLAERFPDNSTAEGYNTFLRHCRYQRTNGYHHYGCNWKNEMITGIANWRNRGMGVQTASSSFSITRFTTQNGNNPVRGSFKGLDLGVNAVSKSGRILLAYNDFEQNHLGAYFSGGLLHRVYMNTFLVGKLTNIAALDEQPTYGQFPGNNYGIDGAMVTSYEGLAVLQSDLMEIAENTCTGVPTAQGGVSDDYPLLGIRIRATGTEEMVVRKNTLSKLTYGNMANGLNAGGTGTSGLRYICNINSLNQWDFINADFTGTLSPEIGMIQMEPLVTGVNPNWPAGNTFTVDEDVDQTSIHFRNEGVDIQAYWHRSVDIETPMDFEGINVLISSSIPHSCPSSYSTSIIILPPSGISGLVGSGIISQQEAEQYRYVYLSLLDDGNTAALQQFVEDTWGAQVWATREHLLSISPYVTSTVLVSMLYDTQTYPHAVAFEILMANPDVLDDPQFIAHLSGKPDPMPQYMIDLLVAYAPGSTSRTEMEMALAILRTRHISTISNALWSMMDYEDDTYEDSDFEEIVDDIHTLNAELATVEALLEKGDVYAATQRATDIPNIVPFGKGEYAEYTAYMQWLTLRTDMVGAERTWAEMNAGDIAALEALLLLFDTYAGQMAMEILNEYAEGDYFMPPAYGSSGTWRRQQLSAEELSNQMVEVFPNPADYITTISLKEALPTSQMCRIVVVDLLGKAVFNNNIDPLMMQFSINTKSWAAGLYTFKIVIPDTQISINGRFDVVH